MSVRCLVCQENLDEADLVQLVDEFKKFPAHPECFDSFENADEFLTFAKQFDI